MQDTSKFKYSVDGFEIITGQYDIPEKINCWCYIPGYNDMLEDQYVDEEISYIDFGAYILPATDFKDLTEYFAEEDCMTIWADLSCFVNKVQGRKETYEDKRTIPDLFATFGAALSPIKRAS